MGTNDFVHGGPLMLLRIEGAAVFAGAILGYGHLAQSWWLFGVLFLTPDLSMLGYLVNARIGAASYNAVHTEVGPVILFGFGLIIGNTLAMSLGLIWLAHIGLDRMLGFGLKSSTSFSDTHLGLLGIRKAA